MSDKITTDANSVSYPNEKPGPDARIANPSPGNQKTTADSQAGDEQNIYDIVNEIFEIMMSRPLVTDRDMAAKKLMQSASLITAYTERRATERAVDELNSLKKQVPALDKHSGESWHRGYVSAQLKLRHIIKKRTTELSSALTKEIHQ